MTVHVFDTGALIALERREARMSKRLMYIREHKGTILVPTPVLGEWWRGRSDWREKILAATVIQPLESTLAKLAGEALAQVEGATLIDAIVMAVAARSGGVVYTSDFDDLARLSTFFPGVRLLSA